MPQVFITQSSPASNFTFLYPTYPIPEINRRYLIRFSFKITHIHKSSMLMFHHKRKKHWNWTRSDDIFLGADTDWLKPIDWNGYYACWKIFHTKTSSDSSVQIFFSKCCHRITTKRQNKIGKSEKYTWSSIKNNKVNGSFRYNWKL